MKGKWIVTLLYFSYMASIMRNKFDYLAENMFPILILLIPNSAKVCVTWYSFSVCFSAGNCELNSSMIMIVNILVLEAFFYDFNLQFYNFFLCFRLCRVPVMLLSVLLLRLVASPMILILLILMVLHFKLILSFEKLNILFQLY